MNMEGNGKPPRQDISGTLELSYAKIKHFGYVLLSFTICYRQPKFEMKLGY